ncbi:DUF4097 domain-containing protein [Salipaludibacillus keqinensis]|uniref:DUF4097 domain-containing protein n=1 Tax=Salipaludibacillus keqinensis TaxID=2045207 RepID=A0A323TDT7_9BACI|nr:DUF4097 domain-containing protein [Salipaludibacillus keqinensis]PYZ92836.1 DUF4097 domain-containing protein [Salipaludibacillus keqinensis]
MHEERKMILKMIEDGKISAEEGLQLLNALRDDKDEPSNKKPNQEKRGPHGNESFDDQEQTKRKETDHYLSRNVNWDGGGYRRAEEKMTTFASRFSEFVEEAVHKIKEFDLDFNFGSSVEVEHIFQHKGAVVKDVDIHVENGSVTFLPWDEDDIRIKCQVKVYKVRDTDEARRVFLDDVHFSCSNEKVRMEAKKKSMKVNTVVYVPKQYLEKIKLYAFNGKVTGENVTVKTMEAKTVNGRVDFQTISADHVQLETVNGTISVSHLASTQTDVKTVNGTVSVQSSKGDLDVETLNGTIHYTLVKQANARAYMKTTTGSVNVRVPDNVKTEGELKTTVGGIQCDLPKLTIIDEKKDFASKKMSFLANKQEEAHFYLEAEATTGTIAVKTST